MGNEIGNIASVSSGSGSPAIKAAGDPFAEMFSFTDVCDEHRLKAFVSSTEKLIRTSREYSTYISDLRTNIMDLNHDNIMMNVTDEDASMEFHHYPYTLYDICEIVLKKRILDGEEATTFAVAKEVMGLHYKNMIGIVPLTVTTHELAHANRLFIKSKQIFGDYKRFGEEYDEAISADLKAKVAKMEELSLRDVPSDFAGLLDRDGI